MAIQDPENQKSGRRTLLLFVGFALLGVALALILFGSDLFGAGDPEAEAPAGLLDQVPQLQQGTTTVAERVDNGQSGPPEVGELAPNFVLLDLQGNEISLRDFEGQPVVLNFWATWCAPCLIEMPELQAAYESYEDQGLVILAVNREEEAGLVREFFYEELALTFTPLLDEEADVATEYGIFSMPTTYFINREGTVTALHRGPLTAGQLESYLAEILPEEA